ncbi:MAG: cAMP-binding protein [Acidobacteria bacterium]|jgi:CRP-like cAMP-binding protein/tetratricopeptide (TPR) repeat protein|nr:cAMP-binding protein [Acidobacteriota bacterium]
MPERPTGPPDLEELVALARRFADRKRFDEAIELFQLALRLEPQDLGLRLAVARLRKLKRAQTRGTGDRDPVEAVRDELRRASIDAAHFVGLAWLYAEKGEEFRALECLEIARAKDPISPAAYKLAGRLHHHLQDFDAAADQLRKALRFNPFDRESAELLGQVEYERRQYAEAMSATIDAFLLLPSTEEERAIRLRRRIRTLRHLLGWQSAQVVSSLREREEVLHIAFDRLQWRRERFRGAEGLADSPSAQAESAQGRLSIAARLRRCETWSHLTDEQIFKLSSVVGEETAEAGSLIFASASTGTDFYLLEEGEVDIQRPTPYGTFPLAVLKPGSVFGEVGFVAPGPRTGDALASRASRVLRFDGARLAEQAQHWSEYGVQIYWGLWHSLAGKLRATNEQLKTFFSSDKQPENFLRLRRARETVSGIIEIPSEEKLRMLREQGLSGKELTTLANFSRELRFEPGSALFEEGDEGHEMYVVLEGKVLISKYIPGAGEEALAILERGDFFGEMTLIDGEPRSADARAHEGPVTVLALDQGTIQEMLALDPEASLEFLKLLCRLVAKRLREIDEKVTTWRIFVGPGDERVPV